MRIIVIVPHSHFLEENSTSGNYLGELYWGSLSLYDNTCCDFGPELNTEEVCHKCLAAICCKSLILARSDLVVYWRIQAAKLLNFVVFTRDFSQTFCFNLVMPH